MEYVTQHQPMKRDSAKKRHVRVHPTGWPPMSRPGHRGRPSEASAGWEAYDGAEVVQVYVSDVASSVARPVRELKGFAKVLLAPGASQEVTIELNQRAFAFWSILHGRWTVEAGDFVISAGHHSRDLPLTQLVTVHAPRLAAPLTRDSTLQEWLDDPSGRALIEAEVAKGQPSAMLEDELLGMVGTMPMSTLANFGGMSLDHDALDRVAAAWQQQVGGG